MLGAFSTSPPAWQPPMRRRINGGGHSRRSLYPICEFFNQGTALTYDYRGIGIRPRACADLSPQSRIGPSWTVRARLLAANVTAMELVGLAHSVMPCCCVATNSSELTRLVFIGVTLDILGTTGAVSGRWRYFGMGHADAAHGSDIFQAACCA